EPRDGPRVAADHGPEGEQGDDSLAAHRGRRGARRGRRAAARQRQGRAPLALTATTHATRLRGLASRVAGRGGFTPMLCTNTSSPPSQPAIRRITSPATDTATGGSPIPPIHRSQRLGGKEPAGSAGRDLDSRW